MSSLNLFPARVPIGVVQPDGTVLMTPEFVRAMRALSERLGGIEAFSTDDLAILASSVAQTGSAQSQAIEDIAALTPPDFSGLVAALLAEVQELRSQANQFIQIQSELTELRKDVAGLSIAPYDHPFRSEVAEVRKTLEGVELLATYRDPGRVDWEHPGKIGSLAANSGAFTTISATGQITSTLATGTAPFVVSSTTQVSNLNVSQLEGKTWAVPGTIGSTTPSTGAFTTISASGQITSTVATGTAPFSVASTTVVPNLNVSQLLGGTWAIPGTIGSTTPNTGSFTTLTASGNLFVGVSSGSTSLIIKSVSEGFDVMYSGGSTSTPSLGVKAATDISWNAAATAVLVAKNSSTSRSINAAGTVNASGADYAEYMTKAADCGTIAKGAIVGVDADGWLTDKWDKAVSFRIKSTNPSYVGGDVWGTEAALGIQRPVEPAFVAPVYTGSEKPADLVDGESSWTERDAALAQYESDQAAYADAVQASRNHFDTVTMPAYEAALAVFEAKLEAERQKVDRIAYCGQVPVNVLGAEPGQYVVPVKHEDGIGGQLVNDDEITFEQYRHAVGVVQNILPDGRANVVVKVI